MSELPIIALCLSAWAIVSLGLVGLQGALIKRGSMEPPGGGRKAVIVRSMLWPVGLLLLVIGLVIVAFD
jgi:hypothetical protein